MEEIDARLVEAEQVKSNWTPVQDLVIDSLSEQMDDLKVTIATVLITHCDLLFACFYLFLKLLGASRNVFSQTQLPSV